MAENQKAREEFEETLRNLNIRAKIEEEVRKMKEEKGFTPLEKDAHKNDFESIPDANNANDLGRIAGKLGLHYNNPDE